MNGTNNTPPPPPQVYYPPEKPRRSPIKRLVQYIGTLIILLSLVMNVYLVMLLAAMQDRTFRKNVLSEGDETQIVAVYRIDGIIAEEAARDFSTFTRRALTDENIKAVVLRVNTPGGTVAASEEIHHQLTRIKQSGRPIVVSMGAMATSGGYLISTAGEEIYAEPSTLTGSIGVIAQIPNIEGTMDKLGIDMQIYKSTRARAWKDAMNMFRQPQPREVERLIDMLDAMQRQFEQYVRDGRGEKLITRKQKVAIQIGKGEDAESKTVTETAPFNGQVYLPIEARQFGLIDKVGYIEDAIDAAGTRASLSNPRVVAYTKSEGLLAELFGAKASLPKFPSVDLDAMGTPRFMMLWKME